MTTSNEEQPVKAPSASEAKQTGKARAAAWAWMERSVWTDRMLDALREGVFQELGLFNLAEAHSSLIQSSRRNH